MKASQAGTDRYICERSILADSQQTLTQRCFAGDMCAFSMEKRRGGRRLPRANGRPTPRSRTITPSVRWLFGCVQEKVGTGFTRVFERPTLSVKGHDEHSPTSISSDLNVFVFIKTKKQRKPLFHRTNPTIVCFFCLFFDFVSFRTGQSRHPVSTGQIVPTVVRDTCFLPY